ncbi:hypothetical protein VEE68_10840 [Escherichia coli]|nr:hypothetical protein VEE68_10840 [Escherichia coli]
MQTQVLFEHPLNEKMRTWLRIEFLIQQLTVNLPIVDHAGALHFFRNVSELLDVFERGEVRTELLKELDRQQRKLQTWIGVPGVDQSRIEALIQQLKAAGSVLISAPRIGQFLREDRLIALVRQRLSIPGGCCSFDLPTLHILAASTPGAARQPGRNLDCQPEPAHPGTYHGAGFNSPVGPLP